MLAACGPAPSQPTRGDGAARSTGPKRITAAITSRDPATLRSGTGVVLGGAAPGVDLLEDLIHAGAAGRDDTDNLRPVLAEAVPSAENGLWKVFPDGRMETTWTLKSGALWQDGTPFTTQDLLFTLTVCRDKEMIPFNTNVGFDNIETASAADDRTITVTWKQPFTEADTLFTSQFGLPIPRHLVERAYQENKRGLPDLPYWTHEFIGTGPFQVRDWVDGSHLTLSAFDRYILGRPKLDEIVVKFIPDPNALVANMLAGEIDLNLGRGLSLDQALALRDQWQGSRLEVGLFNWVVAWPQFINPRPALLGDARFRKALVHALDRQEMADALQSGLTPVPHSYFNTSLPQYQELDPLVVKYEFDPRKALQLIESTGYGRGADGSFRDPAGQALSIESRNTGQQEIQTKAQLSIADYWQRIGIAIDTVVIGPQRAADREYRATRPGFDVTQNADGPKGLRRAHSSQTPLPENSFGKNGNEARYINPDFDALLDRFFSTIPIQERTQVLGQILHHTTDVVTLIPLLYGTVPTVTSNRLVGVGPRKSQEGTNGWNASEWDVR